MAKRCSKSSRRIYQKIIKHFSKKKKIAIGYTTKLTSASVATKSNSPEIADWYLFPDQLKLTNVHIDQIDQVVEKLFIKNQSSPVFDKKHSV